jgi:cell division protein FtsB
MSNASAQTAPGPPGDATSDGSRRSRRVARRRLFLLGFLLVLIIAGMAANYGPLRHYQDARARLDKVAARVAGLEEQRTLLQGQLAKLSEAGYLEGLAREELTYARPDEELYIVTEPTGGEVAAGAGVDAETSGSAAGGRVAGAGRGSAGIVGEETGGSGSAGLASQNPEREPRMPNAAIGAVVPGADLMTGTGVGAVVPGAERSEGERIDRPGVLERIVAAIAGLF